jgi:hypothetical protein
MNIVENFDFVASDSALGVSGFSIGRELALSKASNSALAVMRCFGSTGKSPAKIAYQ